jgi:hypothetical protein
MSLITGRGLGELEMFTLCDLFEEWWARKNANAQAQQKTGKKHSKQNRSGTSKTKKIPGVARVTVALRP